MNKKHETHPCPEKNIGYKPCLSRILYQYNDMKIYRCSNIYSLIINITKNAEQI